MSLILHWTLLKDLRVAESGVWRQRERPPGGGLGSKDFREEVAGPAEE